MKLSSKIYRVFLISIFYIGLALLSFPTMAQDNRSYNENTIEEKDLTDLKELAKYDKTVNKLTLKNKEKNDEEEQEIKAPNFSFGLGPILTPLLYVFILALVIFIIYIIFSSIKVEKKITPTIDPAKEEIEDIEVIDAESGLELALKAENYREAVRMLFIKLLQVLVQENSIEWKPEKTNRHYLAEMKNHSQVEHFNNLVIAYERIWYGSEPIDKLFFDYLKVDFEKFYSTENVSIDVKE